MTKNAYMFLARNEKMCWDFIFGECREHCRGSFKHSEGGKEAGLCELTTMVGESGVAKFGGSHERKKRPV